MDGPDPLKHVIIRCLQNASAGLEPHTRSHSAPGLPVLMYHQILPLNDDRSQVEEPGMIVTPESFSNHLKLINKYFDSIRLYDWVSRRDDGCALPSKTCADIFDECRSDNHEFALTSKK